MIAESDPVPDPEQPDARPSLAQLRQRIDAIDDQIHDLIMERGAMVDQIAAAKARDGNGDHGITGPAIRPAREAEVLRRLAARHQGPFPFPALARMWHEMSAAFTMLQAGYSLACLEGHTYPELRELARGQFGSMAPITLYKNPLDLLQSIVSRTHHIGVLPFPGGPYEDKDTHSDGPNWWGLLRQKGAPRVIMRVPFVTMARDGNGDHDNAGALAIAKMAPVPTGDDRTLMVLRDEAKAAYLVETTPGGRMLCHGRDGQGLCQLIELSGFFAQEDMTSKDVDIRIIGAYARTLMQPETEHSSEFT